MLFFGSIAGLFGLLIVLLAFIFWIWMLVDCIQNQRLTGMERLVWVLVIVFLHALGGLIYYLVGRNK